MIVELSLLARKCTEFQHVLHAFIGSVRRETLRTLPPEYQRVHNALENLHGLSAIAAKVGLPERDTQKILTALVDAQLIVRVKPGYVTIGTEKFTAKNFAYYHPK